MSESVVKTAVRARADRTVTKRGTAAIVYNPIKIDLDWSGPPSRRRKQPLDGRRRSGAGLEAKMVANTNPTLKKRVGWLACVHAVSKALRDKDELHLRYRFNDGETRSIRAHTMLVGNCGTLPANMLLLPDARLDDGAFGIVFLRPTGFLGWIQIWVRVAWENRIIRRTRVGKRRMGETKDIRALQYDTAKSVTARFNCAEEIELDGDAFGRPVAFHLIEG